jgi:hypothetical protein
MSILDDIQNQRDAAIAILQQKIDEAVYLKNGGAARMDDVIDALMTQQAYVAAENYIAGLDDPTMAQALAALHAATNQMNTVAARMVSAATFITNVASLGTATNKVVSALRGGGGLEGDRPNKRG